MRDASDEGIYGFLSALLVVALLAVTVFVSRCSMIDTISDYCDDYGKFESNKLGRDSKWQWYDCANQAKEQSK
jgi:hypothetical protein